MIDNAYIIHERPDEWDESAENEPEEDCDHPFRVPGDMCLNCGEWDMPDDAAYCGEGDLK